MTGRCKNSHLLHFSADLGIGLIDDTEITFGTLHKRQGTAHVLRADHASFELIPQFERNQGLLGI